VTYELPDEDRCTEICDNGERCSRPRRFDDDICGFHIQARIRAAAEPRCIGVRTDGAPCGNAQRPGYDTCWRHDPNGYEVPDAYRCTGHVTGGFSRPEKAGQRCRNWRIPGLNVCRIHGGATQGAKEAARIRVAEHKLEAAVSRLAGTPVENPLSELAAVAGRAKALMDILEQRVQDLLDVEAGEAFQDETRGGIRYKGTAGEQIRGEVVLYERAIDRFGKLLVDIGRLNIDERLARINEMQIEAFIGALEAGLNAAGVRDPQQRAQAKTVAARHLRSVEA
jgi:hypothetical protein